MPKVIVSFTCLPSRINNIGIVLNSIKEQTVQPDSIIIHYPKRCIRLNETYDVDALRMKLHESQNGINNSGINNNNSINNSGINNIIVNECDDYGPITKIFPLLNLTTINDDDMIIVIDDDNYYNKFLFEYLINEFKSNNKEKAVCVSGLLYPRELNAQCACVYKGHTELMEASFGYIIKKSFLQDDFRNWVVYNIRTMDDVNEKNWYNSFLSDDYVLSNYLDTKHIQKKVLDWSDVLNKLNCVLDDKGCVRNDSLCAFGERTLDKYVKSGHELKQKGLIA